MVYQWIVEWYKNGWLGSGKCVRMAEQLFDFFFNFVQWPNYAQLIDEFLSCSYMF